MKVQALKRYIDDLIEEGFGEFEILSSTYSGDSYGIWEKIDTVMVRPDIQKVIVAPKGEFKE